MGEDMNIKSAFSNIGSRNMGGTRTSNFHQRNYSFKHMENERKEIEEVQESMKEMDDFDRKYGSVKSKVGYPRIALKSDLKKF